MWRFEGGPQRQDAPSQIWLSQPEPPTQGQGLGPGRTNTPLVRAKQQAITSANSDNDVALDQGGEGQEEGRVQGQVEQGQGLGPGLGPGHGYSKYYYNGIASITALWSKPTTTPTSTSSTTTTTVSKSSTEQQQPQQHQGLDPQQLYQEKVKIRMTPPSSSSPSSFSASSQTQGLLSVPIEVAIMGGHMNNHPAGQVPNPNYHNLPSHTYPAHVISSPSHSFLQKSF